MDSDLMNIAIICLLMGVGIVMFIIVIFVYLAMTEIFETIYTKD
jgi:hypothetical protein